MKRVNFLVRFLSIAAMLLCVSCRDEIEPLSEDSDEENLISSELLEVVSFGENRSIDEILDGVNRSSGVNHSRSSIKSLTIKDSLKLAVPADLSRGDIISDSVSVYCVYDSENNISTLVSGSRLYPFILAEIEGEFNGEGMRNYGLNDYFTLLPKYLAQNKMEYSSDELTNVESQLISADYSDGKYSYVIASEIEPLPFQRIEYETIESFSSVINPIIDVKWGQWAPYNNTLAPVLDVNGIWRQPPTGCVAVAICQILSEHKNPSSITFNNMYWQGDWNAMTQYPSAANLSETYKTQVAELMNIVGKGVNTQYALSGSGSNINYAYNFIKSTLNFKADAISNYSYQAVVQSLNNGRPVYVRGTDTIEGGHAWVLDGSRIRNIKQYERIYQCKVAVPSKPIVESEWRLISTRVLESSTDQVHCNWGWSGDSDGYFQSEVFNVSNKSFNEGVMIITNIRPN